MSGAQAAIPQGPSNEQSARRIQIRVPESYKKVDESVWEDLETYLYTGFLSSPAIVAGKSIVFKTLNHLEIRNISFLKPMNSAPPEARAVFRAAFIAHSIFMIDGQNALHERPRHITRLIKIITRLQPSIQDKILENLAALNQKASRLHPLTEVYVHENRSRYHWLHLQSIPIHTPLATGLPGTEELGMNYCQQTWTVINRLLDRKDEAERDWSNSKFIGSCFNSKGVRSIDERDRGRKEKERVDQEERKMTVLYRYLNRTAGENDEPPSTIQLPDKRMATVEKRFRADSAEELAEQLSAALSGEKDHHDLIVEAHEQKLRERFLMINDYQKQIQTTPQVELPNSIPSYSTGVRILGGKKEADEYLARMQKSRLEHQAKLTKKMNLDLARQSEGSDEEEG
jgi:hypothetical protein